MLQNIPQFTKFYSSPSAAAAVQKKNDEDKLNHEDEVVTTKISIQHPADLSKLALQNLTTTIKQQNELTAVVVKREQELPWRITPSQDINRRFKHYLMLSKIRLTCKS